MLTLQTARGRSIPLGTTALVDGVNFALFCRHGTAVTLVLESFDGSEPMGEIALHPHENRTGNHWHILVGGLPPQFRYGWRVDGPPGHGHRYNPKLVLIDPSATALSDGAEWGRPAESDENVPAVPPATRCTARRSLFFRRHYNWDGDAPPLTPLEDSIIYELHVRGFTCHPSSGVGQSRHLRGLVEKIPYLKELGVTAVELLPIHEFDECDCPFTNPLTGERLRNFWGYNSIAFAAPKASLRQQRRQRHGQVTEFRDMVRAFHEAGIEVILDVVFNHTGEGDDRGRTYSFRGLDNELYYLLGPGGTYLELLRLRQHRQLQPSRRPRIDPDLPALLGRRKCTWTACVSISPRSWAAITTGNVLIEPPIVEMIAEDGVLADTKLIAEPWDAAGLYQVGRFPFGRRWSEWNGRYRDDVRRFWRGEAGLVGDLATRLCGSSDLYQATGRLPHHSVNFITCHDGFTLWDLVCYNQKHNEANGENNRDGSERQLQLELRHRRADRATPNVLGLRRRQAKNLMATLLLSQGVPMLLAGDEFLRTQKGNNNAWCQDNEIELGRLGFGEAQRRLPALCPRADRPAQTAPGLAAADVFPRQRPPHRRSKPGHRLARRRARPARFFPDQPHARFRPGRQPNRPRARPRFLHRLQFLARADPFPHPALARRPNLAPRGRYRLCRRRTTSFPKEKAPRSRRIRLTGSERIRCWCW